VAARASSYRGDLQSLGGGRAERGARFERRLHLLSRLVGSACVDWRGVGRWSAAPDGPRGVERWRCGTMLHIAESATRFTPVEVWEARNPWRIEKAGTRHWTPAAQASSVAGQASTFTFGCSRIQYHDRL